MSAREDLLLNLIEASASIGVTLREIQDATAVPTIEAVRTLGELLAQGRCVRLLEVRRGFPVYVLPGDVRGREISKSGVCGMAVSNARG